jgi:two-component system OmpR family response regulator
MTNQVPQIQSQRTAATAYLTVRVLILDDDESFRALARAMLEPAGFEVIESADLPQCLQQLTSQAVDAVILDMVMPGSDGFDALRECKHLFPKILIVTVSGASESELYLTESAHLGADASLEKSRIGVLCPLLRVILDR